MNNLIEDTIVKYNMLDFGDTVIVALSGGADSVCLLHNFNSIKEKYNLNLKACHVNHHLRGEESNRDMEFCRDLCFRNNIEIFIKEADIDAMAKERGQSHEECGRKVRYEYFNSLSEKYNAKIATAHNADDNLETVIYNLIRGTSLRGLSGIPKERGAVIRPLIFSPREEIEEYCREYSLTYVTDSSNLTDNYTRNKIRHNVVPVLKEINPSAEKTVLQMNGTLYEISEYIEKSANLLLKIAFDGKNGYLTNKLKEANSVILKEAIAVLFRRQGFTSYSARHIEETLSVIESGGKINLKNDLCAVNKQGLFRVVKQEENDFFSVVVTQNNPIVYKNRTICFRNVKINRKFKKTASKNFINNDIITPDTKLRNRIAGDSIKLSRRGVTKSLKKLMNELKIPEEQRDSLLVLASGNEVHWIEGIGVSERAGVRESDREVTEIFIEETNE